MLEEDKNIVLVGPMGVGKSTIGRMLAQLTQREFKDTDHVVEERTGADIPWIFDVEGEEGFRARETSVLQDLLQVRNLVLATGGGIVTREENRELLNNNSVVVYLTASVEQLYKRTRKDKKRPLLQVENPKAKIEGLIAERAPLYESVSHYQVSTDNKTPKAVAEKIFSLIKQ
ncbi:shikimate kinase AroK [Sessilibacter sp. MAH2]